MARSGRSRGRVLAGAGAALLLVAGVVALVVRGPNPTSAEFGREGVRELERAPDDLPPGLVPSEATQVQGSVARSGEGFSASVTWVAAGDLDAAIEHVTEVLEAASWTFRQRAFDDTTHHAIWDGPEGRVLTVTATTTEAGTAVAAVLQGRRSGG